MLSISNSKGVVIYRTDYQGSVSESLTQNHEIRGGWRSTAPVASHINSAIELTVADIPVYAGGIATQRVVRKLLNDLRRFGDTFTVTHGDSWGNLILSSAEVKGEDGYYDRERRCYFHTVTLKFRQVLSSNRSRDRRNRRNRGG